MCPLKLITWTENFDNFRNYICHVLVQVIPVLCLHHNGYILIAALSPIPGRHDQTAARGLGGAGFAREHGDALWGLPLTRQIPVAALPHL